MVLGYSVKSKGIAKVLFGTYENYVQPVQSLNEPNELKGCFLWILEQEKEIRKKISNILPEYTQRVYRGEEELKKIIK